MGFSADVRAAAVTLLTSYATSASIRLQIYQGRPLSIYPPCAFLDALREVVDQRGITLYGRVVIAEVVVIHGTFDSAESVAQRDAFVDGFLEYVSTQAHAAGSNTLIAVSSVDDIPVYVPDWPPPEKRTPYFATQINLEARAENNPPVLP